MPAPKCQYTDHARDVDCTAESDIQLRGKWLCPFHEELVQAKISQDSDDILQAIFEDNRREEIKNQQQPFHVVFPWE